MDPYSAEGELVNIHNHFYQGQYQEVIDFDISNLAPKNEDPARALELRARIALGQAEDVLAEVQDETSVPEFAAVAALAQSALGQTEEAVQAVEKLVKSIGDNQAVQVIGGIVLQAAGKSDEALALLSRHTGSRQYTPLSWSPLKYVEARVSEDKGGCFTGQLRGIQTQLTCYYAVDAIAVITQIHLQQNRTDLAVKEVAAARRWAQDSLLVNLTESWVGLRLVRPSLSHTMLCNTPRLSCD